LASPAAAFSSSFGAGLFNTKQPSRALSGVPITGGGILIDNNEFEGSFQFSSGTIGRAAAGPLVFSRNHIIGLTNGDPILATNLTNVAFVNNVVVFADTPAEDASVRKFVDIALNNTAINPSFPDAKYQRILLLNTTFVDRRQTGKLESGDTGALDAMFAGVDDPLVISAGNVVHVPNRSVSAPTVPGFVKDDDDAHFETDAYATPFYSGFNQPTPAEMEDPWTGPSYDAAYATPSTAGESFQPNSGATFLTAVTVDALTTPAFGIEGAAFSGASRPAGAWTTSAA
jgi:hypothetical protein